MPTRIEISYKTILFTLGVLALLWFLYQIKDILLFLFVSFLLMAGLKPGVDRLEKLKIPRALAILLIYFLIILFLGTIGAAIIPVMILETTKLLSRLPDYFSNLTRILNLDLNISPFQIMPAGGGVIKFTLGIFSNILGIISLFVFTFYLLLERNHLKKVLENFLDEKTASEFAKIIEKIEKKIGFWLRGQLFLCFAVFLGTFIGLSILRIDYTLALSILAGVLEIVPNIGPIISAIPAILIALSTSPLLALATASLYFLVQQLENHLLVPNIMKKVTGLSPLVIIISLWVGAKLMGFLGMILAVPLLLIIQTIIKEYLLEVKDR